LSSKADAHRRMQSARHATLGQRYFERRQYEQAVHEYALSYIFDPQPELLLMAAHACHRSDLDAEALSVYQQLQADPPPDITAADLNDAVSGLVTKLEDAEMALPKTLRRHLDQGRHQFQEGQFLLSAQEYMVAYLMKPLPRLLFNIAQSFRRA